MKIFLVRKDCDTNVHTDPANEKKIMHNFYSIKRVDVFMITFTTRRDTYLPSSVSRWSLPQGRKVGYLVM